MCSPTTMSTHVRSLQSHSNRADDGLSTNDTGYSVRSIPQKLADALYGLRWVRFFPRWDRCGKKSTVGRTKWDLRSVVLPRRFLLLRIFPPLTSEKSAFDKILATTQTKAKSVLF